MKIKGVGYAVVGVRPEVWLDAVAAHQRREELRLAAKEAGARMPRKRPHPDERPPRESVILPPTAVRGAAETAKELAERMGFRRVRIVKIGGGA